jgi:hypothetical protein
VNNPKFIWSIFMQVLRQGFAVRRVEEPGK